MDTKHLKFNSDLPSDPNKLFGKPWTTTFLRAIKSSGKIGRRISLKTEKECLKLFPYIYLGESAFKDIQWAQEGLQAIQLADDHHFECKMTVKWKRSE